MRRHGRQKKHDDKSRPKVKSGHTMVDEPSEQIPTILVMGCIRAKDESDISVIADPDITSPPCLPSRRCLALSYLALGQRPRCGQMTSWKSLGAIEPDSQRNHHLHQCRPILLRHCRPRHAGSEIAWGSSARNMGNKDGNPLFDQILRRGRGDNRNDDVLHGNHQAAVRTDVPFTPVAPPYEHRHHRGRDRIDKGAGQPDKHCTPKLLGKAGPNHIAEEKTAKDAGQDVGQIDEIATKDKKTLVSNPHKAATQGPDR